MSAFTLQDLVDVVGQRAASTSEKSYTKSLLEGGPARAAQKFGEEAIELVVAAAIGDPPAIVAEAADVLYHLLVLLRSRDVEFGSVLVELERRSGISGHAEKAARSSGSTAD